MEQRRGCFIALEGIDGSGKSTQAALLQRRLERENIPCCFTREPTEGPVGVLLRQILTGAVKTDNRVAAALFTADRLDHLLNPEYGVVRMLDDGIAVVTDRYYFSSYAYQSVDVPLAQIISANEQCAAVARPSVNIFIDVGIDEALRRISANRARTELFETRERLAAVRENYFRAFDLLRGSENVVIVDGSRDERALEAEIWEKVREYFQK